MAIAEMDVDTDVMYSEDGYPTPETFERWKRSVMETDAKIESGEIKIKSVREQFADHGYFFD